MEDFGLDHRAKGNHCWMLSVVCVCGVWILTTLIRVAFLNDNPDYIVEYRLAVHQKEH